MLNYSFAYLNTIKYLDLPIPVGESFSLSCTRSIEKLLDDLRLELGSTYYFTVYYMGNPLTERDVPFNPIKYNVLDIKWGFTDIKNWEYYSQLAVTDSTLESLLNIYKGRPLAFNKSILSSAIDHMIFSSDLIKDVVNNDLQHHVGSIDYLNVKSVGVTCNYVLNLTLVYYKTSK